MEFDEAVRQYQGVMLGYAVNLTRDGAWAEDVVQDVWLKVWPRWAVIQNHGSVKSYLLSAVKTTFLDHLRKRQRRQAMSLEPLAPFLPERCRSFTEDVADADQFHRFVSALDPTWQRVFVEGLVKGGSYQEIADGLGMITATAKTRVSRLKAKGRVALEC